MISAFILSIWLIRALLSSPALPLEKWPLFAIATAFLLQRSVFQAGSPFQCIGALPAMIRASLYPGKEVFYPGKEVFIQENTFFSSRCNFFQILSFCDASIHDTWSGWIFWSSIALFVRFWSLFLLFAISSSKRKLNVAKKKVPKALVTELNFSIPPPHRIWICSLFCKSFLIAWAKSNPEELSVKARTSALHRPDSATQDFWMFLQFNFFTFQTNKHLADRIRLSKWV